MYKRQGVYGTAITILAKATPELAITLAIPIGLLGVLLWNLQMTLNVFWVHRLDANAEKGELNKIFFNAWLFPQLTSLVVNGTPCLLYTSPQIPGFCPRRINDRTPRHIPHR